VSGSTAAEFRIVTSARLCTSILIELGCGYSGDLHLCIEEFLEGAFVRAVHSHVHIAPIHEDFEIDAALRSVVYHGGGTNLGLHPDAHAIQLRTDQLLKSCRDGIRQGLVAQQGHAIGHHDGAEALLGMAVDQNAIASLESRTGFEAHINGGVGHLNKQVVVRISVIGDNRLETDRQALARLGIRQSVQSAERRDCDRLRRPRCHGPRSVPSTRDQPEQGDRPSMPPFFLQLR